MTGSHPLFHIVAKTDAGFRTIFSFTDQTRAYRYYGMARAAVIERGGEVRFLKDHTQLAYVAVVTPAEAQVYIDLACSVEIEPGEDLIATAALEDWLKPPQDIGEAGLGENWATDEGLTVDAT